MNLNFLVLGEHSLYVWPAFLFVSLSFYLLFVTTYKNFKKQQKIYFGEVRTKDTIKISTIQRKEILSKRPAF